MNIFGIGPLELALILLLALIIFGPKDLQKTGKMLGKTLNKVIHSDSWRLFNQTRRELNNLPQRLMRDSQLDDLSKTVSSEISGVQAELDKAIGAANSDKTILPPAAPGPETGSEIPKEKTGE